MTDVKHCFSCKAEDRPLRRITVDSPFISWSMPVCDDCLRRMTGIEFVSLQAEDERQREALDEHSRLAQEMDVHLDERYAISRKTEREE